MPPDDLNRSTAPLSIHIILHAQSIGNNNNNMHSSSAPSRRSDRTPKASAAPAAKAATMKRTQGRQKIQMELIRDPNALQVCFSKRRKGLVKKVFELCVLCDAQVALVVFSPAGKPYSFAHPSFPAVVDRFLDPSAPAPAAVNTNGGMDHLARLSELQREAERLADAVHEAKEVRGKELEAKVRDAGVWVDGDLSRCGAPQLEDALAALLGVQAEAAQRAHEILAQEAMMQQQQQQCLAADGIGTSHGDNLFDYLGSYAAAEHGHGGDLFDYLGSGGGPYYAPDAMGSSTHGHAHEPAMDSTAIDLMCNDAGSFFHYLGSSSGSFMADGGGVNHGEVGVVDTNTRLMGGGMNHGLVPMMPQPPPPPQPPALPFNHGGFDYYNLGYNNNQGDLGHDRGGGAYYEMDGVYGTTCSFL